MMLKLARYTVRNRRRTFVSPFIALIMSAALVTASGILMESGIRGSAPPDRYAGADIVVAASQRLDNPVQAGETVHLPERGRIPATLAEDIGDIPGVRTAIADRSLPVAIATNGAPIGVEDRDLIAQGWASAALRPAVMAEGREPQADNEVALDRDVARTGNIRVGDSVEITSTRGTHSYRVAGLVTADDPESRRTAPVFFTDAEAVSLSIAPGLVDAVGVLVESGQDIEAIAAAIREQFGADLDVLVGGSRSRPESLEASLLNRELVEFGGAFGVTAIMLAVFVVAATLGLSIMQRSREIALLRAVGATPGQVRRMIVGEAAIVAFIAGVAGAVPGILLGVGLFRVLETAGIVAETTPLRLGVLPVGAAVAAGLVAASLAALLAGWRRTRMRPTTALVDATVESPRIGVFRFLFGVLLVGGGLGLSVLAATLEGEAGASAVVIVLLTLIVGIAVLGPVLAHGAGLLGGPAVASLSRTSGVLAMANLRARARRLAAASIPLALAVSLVLTMVGSLATEAAAIERQTRERLVADRVLAAPSGLPPGWADTVAAVPGVAAAIEVYPTSVGAERSELFGERVFEMRPAAGISLGSVEAVLDLDVEAGTLSDLADDTVAISRELARSSGAGLGDEIPLWLGDGTAVTLRVVAIYGRPLGLADFVLPRDTVLPHLSHPMTEHILVRFEDNADHDAVDAGLSGLDAEAPGLRVMDATEVHAELSRAADESASVNYLFIGALAAFVTIAMVNSLVLATAERSRELALLRLAGALPRQVLWMIRIEALVVVAFGVVMGFAVAAATLVPFSLGIGGTAVPSLPAWFVAAVVAGAFALGLLATEIPARLALRSNPIAVATSPT